MSGLPAVLVPHGYRSLPVLQLAGAASGLCRPVFLVDPSDPDVVATRRLLDHLGPVVRTDQPFAVLVAELAGHELAGAVAFRDDDLVLVARLAAALGLRFHRPEVAERLADKLTQRRALAGAGLPGPAIVPLLDPSDLEAAAEAARHVDFPAVLKPRQGSGSYHTFLVEDPGDLARALGEVSGSAGAPSAMVLEEYLPSMQGATDGPFADYVSVETLATSRGLVHVAVTGRTPPVAPFRETGFFLPAGHLDRAATAAVLSTATAALEALEVTTGCLHTEVKLTPDGPRILEVNGRMGGGIRDLLLAASGRDLLVDHLRGALDLPVDCPALLPCQRFGYRFFYQPPVEARRLVSLSGLRELASAPGVESVAPHLPPGSTFDPRLGSRSFLFSVVGTAPDLAGVAAARRQLDDLVEARYELADDYALAEGGEDGRTVGRAPQQQAALAERRPAVA